MYFITICNFFFCLLLLNCCISEKNNFKNVEVYLERIHGIKLSEKGKVALLLINNFECRECNAEIKELLKDLIFLLDKKHPNCEIIIHLARKDPTFVCWENLTCVMGDKMSVFEFGVIFKKNLLLYFENGRLTKSNFLEELKTDA